MIMTRQSKNWRFSRQLNMSVVIELILLAGLILGSWMNLQSQLSLLQHDVTMLLQNQKRFEQRIEQLSAQAIAYKYRLQAIEKDIAKHPSPKTF